MQIPMESSKSRLDIPSGVSIDMVAKEIARVIRAYTDMQSQIRSRVIEDYENTYQTQSLFLMTCLSLLGKNCRFLTRDYGFDGQERDRLLVAIEVENETLVSMHGSGDWEDMLIAYAKAHMSDNPSLVPGMSCQYRGEYDHLDISLLVGDAMKETCKCMVAEVSARLLENATPFLGREHRRKRL